MSDITLKDIKDWKFDKPLFFMLDWDCTLTKSLDPIVNELNKKYGTNAKPKDIKSWNFNEVKQDLSDDEIERLFSLSQFFDELEFYDGAKEFLLLHKDNCMIITKGTHHNIYNKRDFLDLNGLEDIDMIGLPLNISKSVINMQMEDRVVVFIDDGTKNLNDSNADIKIQFREFGETEWNKDWNGMVMRSWI